MNLSVIQQNNKFIILENNKVVTYPNLPNEFVSIEDAIRAIDIIKTQNYVTNIFKDYGL